MRLLIQRVTEARVEVDGAITGEIKKGMLVFVGIARGDSEKDADFLVQKMTGLRIFEDQQERMNLNVQEAGGEILIISQFTLYADCSRGKRPSFDLAEAPERALALYRYFVEESRKSGVRIAEGVFRASMAVTLVNDGPVTIICDSPERLKP